MIKGREQQITRQGKAGLMAQGARRAARARRQRGAELTGDSEGAQDGDSEEEHARGTHRVQC